MRGQNILALSECNASERHWAGRPVLCPVPLAGTETLLGELSQALGVHGDRLAGPAHSVASALDKGTVY